ncbi:hypothetical protein Cgig2_000556 [Carnegiea gigantea]|uniref:Uncharacterized protein n=1 Tax=Carnegiea gigantea TaxID=171969 RepID=A0A9Q1GMD7_9CARY|nr:hypothetical protein Cgig2_009944 [Carnegiea gigantea]KAJ8425207.1 hypothetical protein Cgig2_000556 [Carnegiea gigantea]
MVECSEHWSQPSSSSVGVPLRRGCVCMVTRFSKPCSGQRLNHSKVQGLVSRKRTRRQSRRKRYSSIQPLGRSGITGEERRQRTLGTPLSPFIMVFPPLYDTREMADYVRESFIWHWRRATNPPHPLPEDYHILCLRFLLPKAERAAVDFELPEIVQATFYAMLLNEAVELGVVLGFMAKSLKSFLVGLSWSCFEARMGRTDHELREAQLRQRTATMEVRSPLDGQEESSGSNGSPLPSSDEE